MPPDPATADPDLVKLYSFQVFSKLEGAVTAGMIHLGDRLGLYRVLADAERPLTSAELAEPPVSTSDGCGSGRTTRPPPS